ncbi:NYN domain-containing protein [Microtetraspora sp. NBRC 16547]|uniref:NYN domain-containing protein n=1 Tax=Microtetraspora sp. NBRC 16547 TaxID=3030993 RepID=UPI0024A58CE1|nr:NYN domain-containing protein [Microtetraspora sp. NBRC 16547]GLW96121.1 NYN domain-containing protein [Microtetraspora sp. NBRC 16547]
MAILDLTAHSMAAKYAVLVDVGYLYAAAGEVLLGAKERKEYRVAADELIQSLQKHALERIPGELLRVYWYDAARDRVPTVDQRVIAQLPWVKVRLGNLNARGQQKGVDAQIRSDLEALARHHAVSDTVLIAGDEDMVPAVEAAQAYGVRVHLWGVEPPFGTNQAERLVWESDTVEILSADFLRPYFNRAPVPVPVTPAPSPAQVFAGRTVRPVPKAPVGQITKLGPGRPHVEEVGEHVAQKWILTRGRDNIRDLLPGPILPTVIDTELLIEAEKELGHSLRPYPEARVWLRDGFWARVYREFDLGVGISSK